MSYLYEKNFEAELALGKEIENRVKQRLESYGWTVTSSQDKGLFSDYDLSATNPGIQESVSYEVKYDEISSRTNMVAVELCQIKNGSKIKSGITATKATYHVYAFPGDSSFYLIRTSTLGQLIKERKYEDLRTAGDDTTKLARFNKDFFLSHCTTL